MCVYVYTGVYTSHMLVNVHACVCVCARVHMCVCVGFIVQSVESSNMAHRYAIML